MKATCLHLRNKSQTTKCWAFTSTKGAFHMIANTQTSSCTAVQLHPLPLHVLFTQNNTRIHLRCTNLTHVQHISISFSAIHTRCLSFTLWRARFHSLFEVGVYERKKKASVKTNCCVFKLWAHSYWPAVTTPAEQERLWNLQSRRYLLKHCRIFGSTLWSWYLIFPKQKQQWRFTSTKGVVFLASSIGCLIGWLVCWIISRITQNVTNQFRWNLVRGSDMVEGRTCWILVPI